MSESKKTDTGMVSLICGIQTRKSTHWQNTAKTNLGLSENIYWLPQETGGWRGWERKVDKALAWVVWWWVEHVNTWKSKNVNPNHMREHEHYQAKELK